MPVRRRLLRCYTQDRSESAFTDLVHRYINLIYGEIKPVSVAAPSDSSPAKPPFAYPVWIRSDDTFIAQDVLSGDYAINIFVAVKPDAKQPGQVAISAIKANPIFTGTLNFTAPNTPSAGTVDAGTVSLQPIPSERQLY